MTADGSRPPIPPVDEHAYRPAYTTHSTYFENSEGGYSAGPDLRECLVCGALVGGTVAHNAWHEWIASLSVNSAPQDPAS